QDEVIGRHVYRGNSGQSDRVGADGDLRAGSTGGGDADGTGKCRRGDTEAADVQAVLAIGECADQVVAEPSQEGEDVIANPTIQGVVAGTAGQGVVAVCAVQHIVACATDQHVIAEARVHRVVATGTIKGIGAIAADNAVGQVVAGERQTSGSADP